MSLLNKVFTHKLTIIVLTLMFRIQTVLTALIQNSTRADKRYITPYHHSQDCVGQGHWVILFNTGMINLHNDIMTYTYLKLLHIHYSTTAKNNVPYCVSSTHSE